MNIIITLPISYYNFSLIFRINVFITIIEGEQLINLIQVRRIRPYRLNITNLVLGIFMVWILLYDALYPVCVPASANIGDQ